MKFPALAVVLVVTSVLVLTLLFRGGWQRFQGLPALGSEPEPEPEPEPRSAWSHGSEGVSPQNVRSGGARDPGPGSLPFDEGNGRNVSLNEWAGTAARGALDLEPSVESEESVNVGGESQGEIAWEEPEAEGWHQPMALGFREVPLGVGGGSVTDRVPLRTEIPEAWFEGTKEALKLPHLEPIEQKQAPLMVPPGLRNLALNRSVTASEDLPVIGELAYVTDGDKSAADGSYVELGPQAQWIQIDLERERELFGIWFWHFHKRPRAYIDVVVQISNDVAFSPELTLTLYNADHDNSLGWGMGDGGWEGTWPTSTRIWGGS
jgi:hypothetical protein